MNLSLTPVIELRQDLVDPKTLLRSLLASVWIVESVVLVHVTAGLSGDICRVIATAESLRPLPARRPFIGMKGFQPALSLTFKATEHTAIFHGTFRMDADCYARLLEVGAALRSPNAAAQTFFNGAECRPYTPEDLFDMEDIIGAAELRCTRCGRLCEFGKFARCGATVIVGGRAWCCKLCAELDGVVP